MAKKRKSRKSSSNKQIGFVLLAGAALLAWYLYSNVRRVSVGGASFRVHKVTLNGIEIRILLTIINEGNLNLDVQNFLGQIFYQNSAIGVVTQVAQVTLKPFATGQVEFKADISLLSVSLDLYNIIKSKTFDANSLILRGTLKAEGIDIPINEKLLTA